MKQLHIGKEKGGSRFCLPADAVTQTIALLARRGAGKTYAASTIAEEMLENDQCIVVLDPIGVWWGLRSSSSGRAEGYPILVLGGEHADIPLQSTAGKTVADFIVGERISTILDVSAFGENGMRRFVADFASEFYRKNREAVHWFVDEADEFAPQSGGNGGAVGKCLGAMQNIVRRGRVRGIGVTLITQRSAVLSKSVLTQTECLFAMQATGPHDLKAIEDWLKHHASPQERNKIMGSLTRMQQGEAWVYSPGWLKGLRQIKVRPRRTFDSSATPKAGEKKRSPKKPADVNLGALEVKMSEAVEQAKANDPSELKKQNALLQTELRRAKSSRPVPDQASIDQAIARERGHWESRIKELDTIVSGTRTIGDELRKAAERLDHLRAKFTKALEPRHTGGVAQTTVKPPSPVKKSTNTQPAPSGNGSLKLGNSGMRRILAVLVQSGEHMTARKIALMAGLSAKSGSFANYLSLLRKSGYVDGGRDGMSATPEGAVALGDYEPMPTGRALIEWWQPKLGDGSGMRRIFDALIEAYPNPMGRADLAQAAGMSSNSGSFANYLSKLRTLELIQGSGELKASDVFFE